MGLSKEPRSLASECPARPYRLVLLLSSLLHKLVVCEWSKFDVPRYTIMVRKHWKCYSMIVTLDIHICELATSPIRKRIRWTYCMAPEGRRWGRNRGNGVKAALPASDVADDEGRRDNTGLGIATLSTAAGFLLVITVQAELSILPWSEVWSAFKWGPAIPGETKFGWVLVLQYVWEYMWKKRNQLLSCYSDIFPYVLVDVSVIQS